MQRHISSTVSMCSFAGGHLPSVTIEYRNIEIEADAHVGSSSVPTLTNAVWQFLKVGSPVQASFRQCRRLQEDFHLCHLYQSQLWAWTKSYNSYSIHARVPQCSEEMCTSMETQDFLGMQYERPVSCTWGT